MESRRSSRNHHHHNQQHHQHSQQHQHQLPQQQQQQQQHQQSHQQQNRPQIDGRIKGATRILTAQQHLVDQEQVLTKPEDPSLAMDSAPFALEASNQTHTHHMGTPAAATTAAAPTIERCNSNIYETRGDMQSNARASASAAAVNLLYMDNIGGSQHINPSSSSYNLQSHGSNANTLAAQPIRTDTAGSFNATSNATTNNGNQQQLTRYDSPQVQPCDIKSLFECPICFDYAVPPIYQCQNGHLVCQSCSNKIAHCPTCRVPITEPSIRNLQLDKLASQFQFPCKYNFVGCQWKSYWFKKREHEDICDYISYSCPCPGTSCKWTGLLSQVMPHLGEHHKSITTLSGEDIVFLATDINLKGAVDWVMIQSCFDHHFLLVLEKQENKNGFFAVVQLIGTPKEAEKFKYKLELNGQAKRLVWEAAPRSILDGIQFSIMNNDCLVFDSRTAQHFLSPIKRDNNNRSNSDSSNGQQQSENLGINVTIERVAQ